MISEKCVNLVLVFAVHGQSGISLTAVLRAVGNYSNKFLNCIIVSVVVVK